MSGGGYDRGLLMQIAEEGAQYEKNLDPSLRKQTGCYFTAMEFALGMMRELIGEFEPSELPRKTFLEPCVGTGNFVFAYLAACSELPLSQEDYRGIVDRIYVCDINAGALSLYRKNLERFVGETFGIALDDAYFATHIGGGLLFDITAQEPRYIPLSEAFGREFAGGFDIVVTNPPYRNLKAERGKTAQEPQEEKARFEKIASAAAEHFEFSASGILNLYKLFTEEIAERYLAQSGVCALLVPASILSDKTCAKLRTRLLETGAIRSVWLIEEREPQILSSQALCALRFRKGERKGAVSVKGALFGDNTRAVRVPAADFVDEHAGNAFLVLTDNEYFIRKQMLKHPAIRNLSYISNLRGELDITLGKQYIVTDPTPYRFYRGRHIGYYELKTPEEFASEAFVTKSAKREYIAQPRLVCQQVVNMAKKKRLSFALAPENCVLGNSCNFLAVRPNDDGVDPYFLLGVLNSALIEWFFRLSSSNNHINNYEIDAFPIPVSYRGKENISRLVKRYLSEKNEALLGEIDALVYEAYGIAEKSRKTASAGDELLAACCRDIRSVVPEATPRECMEIAEGRSNITELIFAKKPTADAFERKVLDRLETKYRKLRAGGVLNHTTFKLSALDLEMISSVPQGGNWKNIPQSTVCKSARLRQISKSGGRTTLYGRIDYNEPAYTITTYFNRPGNGTYVHPVHERVLSVREAARFQTFPDSYFFYGNKSEVLKQVGNAVPVLLAYAIGRAIAEKAGCTRSVDLFSGAGGLTYGLKLAGIRALVANDISESACVTLKCNSPEIPVLCGDITDEAVKRRVAALGIEGGADVICGGPPCQGFSLAGFRREDDPRNRLFRDFAEIVSAVSPKVIVFENVEGLLSYQNGNTYRDILALFSELGYHAMGKVLAANAFGVPQRRKRVIVLCTRKDLGIPPEELFPHPITERRKVTAFETISDLESVPCGDDARYAADPGYPILQFLKGKLTASEYFETVCDTK